MQLFKSLNVFAHSQASRSSFHVLASACLRGAGGGESLSNLAFHTLQPLCYTAWGCFTLFSARMKWKCGLEVLIWREKEGEKKLSWLSQLCCLGFLDEACLPWWNFFSISEHTHHNQLWHNLPLVLATADELSRKWGVQGFFFWTSPSRRTVWWQSHGGTDELRMNVLITRGCQDLCISCR